MTSFLAVPGLATKTNASFRAALAAIASRLGVDPNFITPSIVNESGFNPAATNPSTKATGLIQFLPSTAIHLGTTVDALRAMSAEDQLPFVETYFRPYIGRMHNAGDVYIAVFNPNNLGKPPETVIATNPSTVYVQNKSLDRTKKGTITIGDVQGIAEDIYSAALQKPPIVDGDPGLSPLPTISTTISSSAKPSYWLGWMVAAGIAYWGIKTLMGPQRLRKAR